MKMVIKKTITKNLFGVNSPTLEELKEFSFRQRALEASRQKWRNFDEVWRSDTSSNAVTRCLRHALLASSFFHYCGRGSYGPWGLISDTSQCWDSSVRCRRLPSMDLAHLPGTIKPLPTGDGRWRCNGRTPTRLWGPGNKSWEIWIEYRQALEKVQIKNMEISSEICIDAILLVFCQPMLLWDSVRWWCVFKPWLYIHHGKLKCLFHHYDVVFDYSDWVERW